MPSDPEELYSEQLSFRVTRATRALLEQWAAQEDRPVAYIGRKLLSEAVVARQERENR